MKSETPWFKCVVRENELTPEYTFRERLWKGGGNMLVLECGLRGRRRLGTYIVACRKRMRRYHCIFRGARGQGTISGRGRTRAASEVQHHGRKINPVVMVFVLFE